MGAGTEQTSEDHECIREVRAGSDRIAERCSESLFSRGELQQLYTGNFVVETNDFVKFSQLFFQLAQDGPRHRLPLLLSKTWAMKMVAQVLDSEPGHEIVMYL